MKYKKILAVLLCNAMLLGACGKQETEKTVQTNLQNNTTSTEYIAEKIPDTEETKRVASVTERQDRDDIVTIEIGPDKKIQNENGTIICTLYDFKLYDSPQDASVDIKNIETADAKYYMDTSKFLIVKVDIYNVDYLGSDDGSINVSMFTIAPSQQDGILEWYGSYPVYLSEPGSGTAYYHVYVNQGETKTITLGFYVPIKNDEELRSKCKISMFGNMENGYIYDIPIVMQ